MEREGQLDNETEVATYRFEIKPGGELPMRIETESPAPIHFKLQALLDDLARDKYLDGDRKILTLIMRDYIAENNRLGIKARDEQKRADALQQKLDELKNIEKTMLEREQGNRK